MKKQEFAIGKSAISSALHLISHQASAVKKLFRVVKSNSFKSAVKHIAHCKGRVVVSGMGKAGIIGQKISATLSSLGSPSFWMHPADAVHGDLGMVASEDVVLVLSQSGETDEIVRLLPLLKQVGNFIISITGNRRSTLSKYSDVVLDTFVDKESCPLGLAPTTSTTVMLAMGDAIAVSVLQMRGFKKEDYAFLHPGGGIGKRLLQVKDLMRKNEHSPTVFPDTIIKNAILKITRARAGCVSVVDRRGKIKGVFTDGDLRRNIEKVKNILEQPISSVMTRNPKSISGDALAHEALRKLKMWQIDELPVIDKNKRLIGLLDIQDLLKAKIVMKQSR